MQLLEQLAALLAKAIRPLCKKSELIIETIWKAEIARVVDHVREHRLDLVEPQLRKAEALAQGIDPKPETRAAKFNQLAEMYQEITGSDSEAERLFRIAIGLESNSSAALAAGNNLGLLLLSQQRYAEAELAFESLLPRVEERYGVNDREVAACLENLAAAYRHTGHPELASRMRNRSIQIRKILKLPKGSAAGNQP